MRHHPIWEKIIQKALASPDAELRQAGRRRKWSYLAQYLTHEELDAVARAEPQKAIVCFPQLLGEKILYQCALKCPGDALTFAADLLPPELIKECAHMCPWHGLDRAADRLDEKCLMDLALEYPWLALNRCKHRFDEGQLDAIKQA